MSTISHSRAKNILSPLIAGGMYSTDWPARGSIHMSVRFYSTSPYGSSFFRHRKSLTIFS